MNNEQLQSMVERYKRELIDFSQKNSSYKPDSNVESASISSNKDEIFEPVEWKEPDEYASAIPTESETEAFIPVSAPVIPSLPVQMPMTLPQIPQNPPILSPAPTPAPMPTVPQAPPILSPAPSPAPMPAVPQAPPILSPAPTPAPMPAVPPTPPILSPAPTPAPVLPTPESDEDHQYYTYDRRPISDKEGSGPPPYENTGTDTYINYQDFLSRNQGKGILSVTTFAGDQLFPINSARVVVSKNIAGTDYIFYDVLTNVDEGIGNLSLPAPSKVYSEIPDSKRTSFATYTITVTHPRFIDTIFNNVPIFENTETNQRVKMQPKVDGTEKPIIYNSMDYTD